MAAESRQKENDQGQQKRSPQEYASMSGEELLHELEMAGRHPDLALLEELLKRREEVTPTLLKWLAQEIDYFARSDGSGRPDRDRADWSDDDPRWYRAIHAGHLLIAYREPKAVPLFITILRDPRLDLLQEWFETALSHYGPALVPHLLALLQDESIPYEERLNAIAPLTEIATRYVEVRPTVLKALRELLPVDESGQVTLTDRELKRMDGEQFGKLVDFLSFLVIGLLDLRDKRSLPAIKTLYDAGLILEWLAGSYEAVERELQAPQRPQFKHSWDILEAYSDLRKVGLESEQENWTEPQESDEG